mmetsp:Transcript_5445/g.12414  ORF Transcript_5445/g.12414 Transcript_5445/m.12414 type:complete len:112 (-) Transcript_5445:1654-1989(-)
MMNTNESVPPTLASNNNSNNPKDGTISKEDKALATLIISVLLIATCHPCLSHEIAAQLQLSEDAVRYAILLVTVVVTILALMLMVFAVAGKGNVRKYGKEVVVGAQHQKHI